MNEGGGDNSLKRYTDIKMVLSDYFTGRIG